jgi:hypothetical protein
VLLSQNVYVRKGEKRSGSPFSFWLRREQGGGHVRSLKREDDPNAKDYEYPSIS